MVLQDQGCLSSIPMSCFLMVPQGPVCPISPSSVSSKISITGCIIIVPQGPACKSNQTVSCPFCCLPQIGPVISVSAVHSAQCTVHSAQCTVHSTQYTVHSTQCTVHSAKCKVHSAHCTVHSTLQPSAVWTHTEWATLSNESLTVYRQSHHLPPCRARTVICSLRSLIT